MNSRYGWLASTGTALSLVACYGTLAVVAVVGQSVDRFAHIQAGRLDVSLVGDDLVRRALV